MDSRQIIRDEMDFQQRRFYKRLRIKGKLVVEYWPSAKVFLNSIPGITWEKHGNKILITEKVSKMKSYREILNEAKKFEIEVDVRDAGKALAALKDDPNMKFKTDGTNFYIFKTEDDLFAAEDILKRAKIKIV